MVYTVYIHWILQKNKIMDNLKTHVITRVTPEVKRQLEELAKRDRRTLSDYLRIMIEDHIKEQKKEQ